MFELLEKRDRGFVVGGYLLFEGGKRLEGFTVVFLGVFFTEVDLVGWANEISLSSAETSSFEVHYY